MNGEKVAQDSVLHARIEKAWASSGHPRFVTVTGTRYIAVREGSGVVFYVTPNVDNYGSVSVGKSGL